MLCVQFLCSWLRDSCVWIHVFMRVGCSVGCCLCAVTGWHKQCYGWPIVRLPAHRHPGGSTGWAADLSHVTCCACCRRGGGALLCGCCTQGSVMCVCACYPVIAGHSIQKKPVVAGVGETASTWTPCRCTISPVVVTWSRPDVPLQLHLLVTCIVTAPVAASCVMHSTQMRPQAAESCREVCCA